MDRLTNRRVLSNATVPLLGLINTGVIGQLGRPEAIGAVAMGAVILTSIYWIFGFLRAGPSGLVAQSRGAGDGSETGAHPLRALAIAGMAGPAMILLQGSIFAAVFHMPPPRLRWKGSRGNTWRSASGGRLPPLPLCHYRLADHG